MTVSSSALIPHIERFTPEVEAWLRSLPVFPSGLLAFDAGVCRWVKAYCADATTFYRRPVADQGPYLAEGVAGGVRFVRECGDLTGVDYLLGVNEPTGADPESVIQTDAFYRGFARECANIGVKPVGPNIAVGNPDDSAVPLLAGSVAAIQAAGGLVSYHGYGPAQLLTSEEWLLNRAPIRWPALLGTSVPAWAYTEAGWDDVGIQPSGPWRQLVRQGVLTLDSIETQLESFAARCAGLGVRFSALFTFGGSPAWVDYEFMSSPVLLSWLAAHWQRHVGPPAPPPPPPYPRQVIVTPGSKFGSAWLRHTPAWGDTMTLIPRDTMVTVEGEDESGDWLKVTAWLPRALVREVGK